MRILFSPPDITQKEIDNVVATLQSGWITTGSRTKELEKEIAKHCRVKKAVCLNSQTACAEMALRLLEIGPGDEVIVPAYTYSATASIVEHVGATIVMVDIQKNSFEMDYEKLEEAITPSTKAVIPVDIAGIPCDYSRIFEIVNRKQELFIPKGEIQSALGRVAICADAAHSFGATWKDNPIGSVADFTSFSFHAVKNLTTAEGGALTWKSIEGIDDEILYKKVQLFSLHGQSKDAFEKNAIGSWEYDIVGLWYKCNMTDLSASIGLAQLSRYDQLLSKRRYIIEQFDKNLTPLGIEVLKHYGEEYISSGHLYITRIPNLSEERRNQIINEMAESGIATNVHYKPLPMFSAYKDLGFNIADYPNSYARYQNSISLPLHTQLTNSEIKYIVENYTRILKKYI